MRLRPERPDPPLPQKLKWQWFGVLAVLPVVYGVVLLSGNFNTTGGDVAIWCAGAVQFVLIVVVGVRARRWQREHWGR